MTWRTSIESRIGSPLGPGAADARSLTSRLATRYGPGSKAAIAGDQRYFVNPSPGIDYFYLNTHRSLFSNLRLRQAVNYAVSRQALAELGRDPATFGFAKRVYVHVDEDAERAA